MCLSCSGVHRGLGVHVSFVRSITMDAFKPPELARMAAGGNAAWRAFWETHEATTLAGVGWDDCTIRERYDGEAGEEYKARLAAKVEGREYVPGEEKVAAAPKPAPAKRAVPGGSAPGSRAGTPAAGGKGAAALRAPARANSPALGTTSLGRVGSNASGGPPKGQNEAYFARLGAENAGRPEDLPPNQGGRFTGFGSDPFPQREAGGAAGIPGADEFQKDPIAALSKGFGWFGGMVTRGVGEVSQKVGLFTNLHATLLTHHGQIASADLQTHARVLTQTVSTTIQTGSKAVSTTLQTGSRAATDTFARFVEGEPGGAQRGIGPGAPAVDPERKDFWDDFAAAGESRISAKKKAEPERKDFWDDFAAAGEARAQADQRGRMWGDEPAGPKPKAQQADAKGKGSVGTAALRKRADGGDGAAKGEDWGSW
jgi:ADP-ribosylation factor GTPase-activating protein 1